MIVPKKIQLEIVDARRCFDQNPHLHDLLFGQSKAETTQNVKKSTYVFLEAARYFGLVEILESQEADFTCLFSGAAQEELRDVAPYLVKIDDDNEIVKNLLSGTELDDPPWMMWPCAGAVFLRSELTLPELRAHFRHFTRIFDDENEKWNYFRFFAPEVMLNTIANMDDEMFHTFSKGVESFIVPDGMDAVVCIAQSNDNGAKLC